jgi:hypothetical protein
VDLRCLGGNAAPWRLQSIAWNPAMVDRSHLIGNEPCKSFLESDYLRRIAQCCAVLPYQRNQLPTGNQFRDPREILIHDSIFLHGRADRSNRRVRPL